MRTVRFAGGAGQGAPTTAVPAELRLDAEQIRVLGCLVEKESATPDYYPLTLNSLRAACNQKTSRDPAVSYDEPTVREALARLQARNLAHRITSAEAGRTPRYRHLFRDGYELTDQQGAALCILMLRGPQTVGEIRQRTGRLYAFEDLAEVEETLDSLARKQPRALAARPRRRPGEKESRWIHLLSDEQPPAVVHEAAHPQPERRDRIGRLEEEVAALRAEVEELKRRLSEPRASASGS